MLKVLELTQFAAFAESRLTFNAGVNVLVGANGTGKSHAMKIAYGAIRTASEASRSPLPFEERLEERIAQLFQPDDLNVGRIVRRRAGGSVGGGNNWASVRVEHSEGRIEFTLHTKGQRRLRTAGQPAPSAHPVLFLPPREVLSLGPGFVELAEDYQVPFDSTYADAVRALARPPARRRSRVLADLQDRLSDVLGGEVIEEGNRFYVKLSAGARLEAPLMGEGLRKVASLIRLVQNGSLVHGSTLFWDEPEANLNPILTRTIAGVILGLAQAGVQVILATHDFFLASRLSMRLGAGPKPPEVLFVGLTAPGSEDGAILETAAGVSVTQCSHLEELPEALLIEALVQHADDEQRVDISNTFGSSPQFQESDWVFNFDEAVWPAVLKWDEDATYRGSHDRLNGHTRRLVKGCGRAGCRWPAGRRELEMAESTRAVDFAAVGPNQRPFLIEVKRVRGNGPFESVEERAFKIAAKIRDSLCGIGFAKAASASVPDPSLVLVRHRVRSASKVRVVVVFEHPGSPTQQMALRKRLEVMLGWLRGTVAVVSSTADLPGLTIIDAVPTAASP